MAESFLAQIKSRCTYYSIQRKSPISDTRILEIAREVIKHTPSSFNCQSTRFVILLQDEHIRFWEIAKECFKAAMSVDEYKGYEKKLVERQAGYGTVLLYEDLDVIREFQVQFPRFKHHLLDFSEHNNAMQAFNLWTALHLEGFACNLQHVNPIVDQRVVSEWKVSPNWSLRAQLVFGAPIGERHHEKTFVPTDHRILVHGMDREG
ncbi:Nitroreductase [Melanomma pulvis-pyrius CBS 109.77]|uniref:Nitroreductase n=1 Tax=Melanomma pulvis-pyrius CBS 109.77 TaxID=1314802 RepID=A0A6A6XJQ1_9PLEO|nr:Nitroreductase [Melanomma pulvis-pyrius CBS 109.77]